MSPGWRVLAVWGALLVALAAIEIIFGPNGAELGLLGGVGAGVLVAAGLEALRERRPPGELQAVPDASPGAVATALGLTLFVVGWEVGQWLMAIGAGIAVAGLAGVVREVRAERS